jgi:formylglycine-generating enzyme required for sulfatase activity
MIEYVDLGVRIDTFYLPDGKELYGIVVITDAPVNDLGKPHIFRVKDLVEGVVGRPEELYEKVNMVVSGLENERNMGLEEIRQKGLKMFETLFPKGSSVWWCIVNSLGIADGQGKRLRLKLLIDENLWTLPWEWLYYSGPVRGIETSFPFALSRYTSIVRYMGNIGENSLLPIIQPPIQMLVVIANPKNYPIDLSETIEREKENLENSLKPLIDSGVLHIEWIEGSNTLQKLENILFFSTEGPHIIHFICHGERDHIGPYLVFEDNSSNTMNVRFEGLGYSLQNRPSLRLIVLNGCQLADMATKFVKEFQIPAVIAMKFLVSFRAAETFSFRFYASLAKGEPVDAAVRDACSLIKTADDLEWGTPVVVVGAYGGKIFDVPIPPSVSSLPKSVVTPTVPIPSTMEEDLLVLIPAGHFIRGLTDDQIAYLENRYPMIKNLGEVLKENYAQSVYLPGFYMDRYEVTNKQFEEFVKMTNYVTEAERNGEYPTWRSLAGPGKEHHPVVCVSWNDAVEYCKWRSQVEGRKVRLPTADEWEKAARGTDGRFYPWGNVFDPSKCHTAESARDEEMTAPVTRYAHVESPYGVRDLIGNAAEWTSTRDGDYAVVMGGSWRMSCEIYGLPVLRRKADISLTRDDIGFRCVREI